MLAANTVSRDVVLNMLARTNDEPQPDPEHSAYLPAITMLPVADCNRYDLLLLGGAHATA